jgi:membrane protein implicated in regulation of membrane protease activity
MLDGIDIGVVIWLAVAAITGIGEMLSGAFFLLPLAAGAIVAAILAALGVDTVWVLIVFAVISVTVLIWLRRYARRSDAVPLSRHAGAGRYVGAVGVVTDDVVSPGAGRVRVETESWRALAVGNERIEAGSQVRVVEVRGNALIVEPVRG